jgi:branched-chain amino acid transport system ATP-binding protein
MQLLNLQNVTAFYGSSQALFDVNLVINEGEVLALMGRNGMGKSTTVKSITRMLKKTGGNIQFAGQDITKWPTHKVAQLGIGLVPEGRRCFTNLTVYENLHASARQGEWDFDKVASLFPRLQERRDQMAASLSGGEQQMLAIGRALMTNPKLLILDEATEGLAPVVRSEIWTSISRLKNETGMAILLIDKTIRELRRIADRAVILERGKSVWHGQMDELDDTISNQYLGI